MLPGEVLVCASVSTAMADSTGNLSPQNDYFNLETAILKRRTKNAAAFIEATDTR